MNNEHSIYGCENPGSRRGHEHRGEPAFMARIRLWIVAEAYVEMAKIRYERGDIAGALLNLKDALRLHPGSSEAQELLDRINRERGCNSDE